MQRQWCRQVRAFLQLEGRSGSVSSIGCATNLVRFIVQECNEAIIAAYLYKGLDTQTSGERERTLNLASSAAALVTTP